jgi:hypothetical protein
MPPCSERSTTVTLPLATSTYDSASEMSAKAIFFESGDHASAERKPGPRL